MEPDNKDKQIFERRRKVFNQLKGIRVGDWIKINSKDYTRVTYAHQDGTIQTGGNGGSYYLGEKGHIEHSGGLDSGYHITELETTPNMKGGSIWFFKHNIAGGGRGVKFNMLFRVFKVKKTYKPEYHQTMISDDTHIIWADKSGDRYVITKLNEKPKPTDYVWSSFDEAKRVLYGD